MSKVKPSLESRNWPAMFAGLSHKAFLTHVSSQYDGIKLTFVAVFTPPMRMAMIEFGPCLFTTPK